MHAKVHVFFLRTRALPPRLSTVWNATRPGQVLQPWVDGIEPRRKVVVAFDTEGDNFRHELYPGYKASRAEAPEDLRSVQRVSPLTTSLLLF